MSTKHIIYSFALFLGLSTYAQTETPKNILFIIVDDLRPELPSYGKKHIKAPNLDKLAASSVQFNRAFCNVPVCGASRSSMLTGIRPTPNRFKHYYTRIDEDMPEAITLSGLLKNNGYTTISNGKVSHFSEDMENSWSEVWDPPLEVTWRNYKLPENIENETNKKEVPAFENADVPDDAYFDGQIANKTIEDLKKFKKSGEPFLLFAGFVKPHLPFNAPKKYWEYYKREDIKLPVNKDFPKTAPKRAQNWYEMVAYKDVNVGEDVEEELAKTLIHAYYACVSYVDAQIGRVLETLDELGMRDDTIVVLTSDHGFSLSEHNRWSKHSLFEMELQVPLLIRAPGTTAPAQSNSFAELVDLYPTLIDLIDIEEPYKLDGISLVENLKNPSKITKKTAYSRYIHGDTYLSDTYFYSEWKYKKEGTVLGRMLYDHRTDPLEMENLSKNVGYEKLMDSLSNNINAQWKKLQ